jgi:hypothetical protein
MLLPNYINFVTKCNLTFLTKMHTKNFVKNLFSFLRMFFKTASNKPKVFMHIMNQLEKNFLTQFSVLNHFRDPKNKFPKKKLK